VSINLRWSHEWSHFCGTTPEHRARAAGCGNDHLNHGCARGPPRRSTIDRSAPPAAATRSRSPMQRRRLVADLQADPGPPPSEDRRRAAARRWLARAGIGHADVDDVSRHKNRYLAEIYATKP